MEKFPAVDHVYRAVFGDDMIVVNLDFNVDGKQMTFTDVGSKVPGMKSSETINYTAVQIRPQVYIVYWQEKDKMTVVHVEDFENGLVHTHITAPNGDFFQLQGTLTKIQ